jgi:hypothetical protein
MAISALQQSAFNLSTSFNDQVNSVVKQQALIKGEANPDTDTNLIAQVVRQPQQYGFTPAIIADAGWAVTYDAWSSDPKVADGPILGLVQKWFNLLTGYIPPQSQVLAAEPTAATEESEDKSDGD